MISRALIVFLLAGALLFAYLSQHLLGFEPCTRCIEIRFFLSIGLVIAMLALIIGYIGTRLSNAWQMWLNILSILLGIGGVGAMGVAAYWSWGLVALERKIGDVPSCSPLTFYHFDLPLAQWWPGMFASSAPCDDVALLIGPVAYSEASAVFLSFAVLLSAYYLLKDAARLR